jgi:uncharacterized protein YndB with AHSA1/START domain
MEAINWESFTRKTAVKAALKDLYDAWTIPAEIEKWFLKEADFYRASGEAVRKSEHIEAGDTYEWSWFLYDPTEKGKITKANGRDALQFTFAGDCLVDVSLTPFQEYVIVSITQSNIPTDEQSKRNIRLGCDSGWSFYLVNLKSVYEGGLDLRNKNVELKGLLNN